ncbi:MAG TPA: response regulator [Chthoniobacterales bacterium]|nr:response regulator [Chthoniobacterales bacterium]
MGLLRIVHLETDDADAELVRAELQTGAVECELIRVRSVRALLEEITQRPVDIILAERHGPGYDGLRALSMAREKRPGVPFIFVSRTDDSGQVGESLGAGATDFIRKEHLPRLVPSLRRVIHEAHTQRDLQKVRQELLQHAELLDLANDAIVISDAAGKISYWNRGAERMYGWAREEAAGRDVHALLQSGPPEALVKVIRALQKKQHWEGELRQTRRDGVEIVASTGWTLQGTAPDAPLLQLSVDVTDRIRAQEALRRSEERYRQFVDEDLTGNLIMKPDGSIITCNPAFAQIFGFDSIEEAQAANFLSLLHTKKEGADLLASLRPNESTDRHEIEMRQRDGDSVYVAARFIGSFDAAGRLIELKGYLFNDTKRKRLEQQLIQAQKMEGLGTLAGGIAHDFNNILAIILGNTMRLEDWKKHPEQMPEAIKVVRDAVARGASLVQQLLTSARQTEARFTALDLNALVQELEKMLAATFPKTINFVLQLESHLPPAKADRSQIHQVLLNLCVNARDAIPRDGTITLVTGVTAGDELREYFSGVNAERYIFVRVIDNGTGISERVKPHIFEPFYTTKERSKGTGLGLSVVYGVVNNHRGFVQVESEPGHGTTFSVYLPLSSATEPASGGDGSVGSPHDPARTIMLVEDEEMLRELGVMMLEGDGYRVLAAKDGIEAVEMFEVHADEIGLVVCDLGLPRLGGRDVFLRMKEIKPSVRAIVASGYFEPNLRTEILRAGVLDTVQKPYDFREMIEKIRSIVGQPQLEEDRQPQLF